VRSSFTKIDKRGPKIGRANRRRQLAVSQCFFNVVSMFFQCFQRKKDKKSKSDTETLRLSAEKTTFVLASVWINAPGRSCHFTLEIVAFIYSETPGLSLLFLSLKTQGNVTHLRMSSCSHRTNRDDSFLGRNDPTQLESLL